MHKTLLGLGLFATILLAGVHPAVADCMMPADNEIVFYSDSEYQGTCWVMYDIPYNGLNAGSLHRDGNGIYNWYFRNDWTSSLKVGLGQNLTVYEHSNLGGSSYFFAAGTTEGHNLEWLPRWGYTVDFNDRISSITPH